MDAVKVDFSNVIGKINPVHAVGQPPFLGGFCKFDFSPMAYLPKGNIPYSRLHDVGGPFGGNRFVDIPNIFRDFDADVNDPASYDFVFTDLLLGAMHEHGIKPIFRLGVTIENQANFKAYRIHPPKDMKKWAQICEHIVRHYNEGWAEGFHYGIEYGEIWNEPDNGMGKENQMWTGTPEQYYQMYDITAKHLRACFGDSIKIGGYGATSFGGIRYDPEKYGLDIPPKKKTDRYETSMYRLDFFFGFWEYIKAHNTPLDFFSWHSYTDIDSTCLMEGFLRRVMKQYGYENAESHINEWNNAHEKRLVGSSYAAAAAAAMILTMQNAGTDLMCYYDARIHASSYCGLFDPMTGKPTATYYVLAAYGELYALGDQTACQVSDPAIRAVAAAKGERRALMLANFSEEEKNITLDIPDGFDLYLVDRDHHMTACGAVPSALKLCANQVALLKNYK